MTSQYIELVVFNNEKSCLKVLSDEAKHIDVKSYSEELNSAMYKVLNACNLMYRVTLGHWKMWSDHPQVGKKLYRLICRLINLRKMLVANITEMEKDQNVDCSKNHRNVCMFIADLSIPLTKFEEEFWEHKFVTEVKELEVSPLTAQEVARLHTGATSNN